MAKLTSKRIGVTALVLGLAWFAGLIWLLQNPRQEDAMPASEVAGADAGGASEPSDALDELEFVAEPLDTSGALELQPPAAATRVYVPPENAMPIVGEPDLAKRYDDLVARALGGDAEAARELGLSLHTCREHLETLRQLSDSVASNRLWASEAERSVAEERALAYIEAGKDAPLEAMCEGITVEQADEFARWLELGGTNGDLVAGQLFLLFHHDRETLAALAMRPDDLMRFRATASRFLQDAARRCYPAGFTGLAGSYASGIATEIDPVRSFAYHVLGSWSDGYDPSTLHDYQFRTQGLTEAQIRQATAMARRGFDAYCR